MNPAPPCPVITLGDYQKLTVHRSPGPHIPSWILCLSSLKNSRGVQESRHLRYHFQSTGPVNTAWNRVKQQELVLLSWEKISLVKCLLSMYIALSVIHITETRGKGLFYSSHKVKVVSDTWYLTVSLKSP